MPKKIVILHRWQVILAFVAVTVAFIVQGVILSITIDDVQRDRIVSCQRTYEGVRQVFRPLFTPPKHRSAKQAHDLRTFNGTIDQLKSNCHRQTGVKK